MHPLPLGHRQNSFLKGSSILSCSGDCSLDDILIPRAISTYLPASAYLFWVTKEHGLISTVGPLDRWTARSRETRHQCSSARSLVPPHFSIGLSLQPFRAAGATRRLRSSPVSLVRSSRRTPCSSPHSSRVSSRAVSSSHWEPRGFLDETAHTGVPDANSA